MRGFFITFFPALGKKSYPSVFKKTYRQFFHFCSSEKYLFDGITAFRKSHDFLVAPYLESF